MAETFRLIRAHRGQDRDILVWGRTADGHKVCFPINDFFPYFYVPELESVTSDALVGTEFGFVSIYGDRLRKVIVDKPDSVPMLRDVFSKHFEADIPFPRRWLIDQKITSGFTEKLEPCDAPGVELEIGYLDIEVFAGDQMPDAENDPITCICFSDGEEYVSFIVDDVDIDTKDEDRTRWAVIHLDSEEKLLRRFTDLLYELNVDVLTGWNVLWDKEYLEKRCRKYRIHLPLSGTCVFDLYASYRKLYRKFSPSGIPIRSYRLKDIALGEGLTRELEDQANYGKMWKEDKPGLLERNRRHVEWVVEIDKKRKIVIYHWELKELAGLEDLEHTFWSSVLIDTLLLRDTKWVLPSKQRGEHEAYEGAFVMEPTPGVFRDVAVFDLTRFYPQIILSETLDPVILGHYYKWKDSSSNMEDYIGTL